MTTVSWVLPIVLAIAVSYVLARAVPDIARYIRMRRMRGTRRATGGRHAPPS
jgi:hypothetical protein